MTVYERIPRAFQGNCQNPDHYVGAWKLSLNRASGVAVLRPFRSKLGQLSKQYGTGRMTTIPTPTPLHAGVTSTLDFPASFVYTM